MTGVSRNTPVNFCDAISVKHNPSPVLVGILANSPPCGISRSFQVAKKRQSISPGLGGNTQKLDAVVDVKFPNDLDYASIFGKGISHELSDSSSGDLYLPFRMKFANDPVQTHAPHFMDMGLLSINAFN